MIVESQDKKNSFSVDDLYFKLFNNLGKKVVEEDSERWILFLGGTGSGKSLKAMHTAYIANGQRLLKLKNICFDKTEFIQAILDAQKGDVIIADEAISIAFNRASMTKDGRIVAEIANQIRQKNLVVFLCIPDMLNLDFVVLNKINAVVYVSESRQKISEKMVTIKGNAQVYIKLPGRDQVNHMINYLKLKKVYTKDRVTIPMPQPFLRSKGNPIGETYAHPWYPLEETEADYREKKESVLKKYLPKQEEQAKGYNEMDRTAYNLRTKRLSLREISEALNRPISTIASMLERYERFLINQTIKQPEVKTLFTGENVVLGGNPPFKMPE